MKKTLTIIAVVFGLSFSLAGNATDIFGDDAKKVVLNGETVASGLTETGALIALMKYKGRLYKCYVVDVGDFFCEY